MQYCHKLILLTVFLVLNEARGQGEDVVSCPPCDCGSISISSCAGDQAAEDKCDCCKRCGNAGDNCGEGEPECIASLLCLPDDPYSSNYNGKCYELTECLSFGCTDETGDCNCLYSSSCPLKRFPYYTLEECKEATLKKKCDGVDCPPQLTAQDCREGMYFEQGPSYYDDCCPVGGSCVCNMSMCSSSPLLDCGSGSTLVMTSEADKTSGQCCDQYECQKIPGCFHENRQYPLNDTWNETPCKQCHCTEDGVYCTFTNCPQLEDCEITYVPEGDCCPKCFEASEPNGEDPAFVVDVEENGCITDDGQMLQEGEVINPGPCRICKCKEESIMCEEKMCEPLVCHDDQVYAITDEECCPKCMDKIDSPTMEEDNNQIGKTTPVDSSFEPTPVLDNTGSVGTGATMSLHGNQPVPSNPPTVNTPPSLELVMVLDAPFEQVNSKWSNFSQELVSMLSSYSINIVTMDIKEDMGKAILILGVMKDDQSRNTDDDSEMSESQLAVMVSRTAQEYLFVGQREISLDDHTSPLGIDDEEFNITVIVLTMIAAVALVSFIGVLIGVILITRRLKTVKAIKGQTYKKSTTRP